MRIPAPFTPRPPRIVRPWIATVCPGMTWKTRNVEDCASLATVSRFGPGPWIEMLLLMASSAAGQGDCLSIEGGIEINNVVPSPAPWTAARSEPGPLSARVVTGKKPEPFGKEGGPAQAPPSKAKRSRPLRRRTGRGKGKEEKESLMRAMS